MDGLIVIDYCDNIVSDYIEYRIHCQLQRVTQDHDAQGYRNDPR